MTKKLGITINKLTSREICLTRTTLESEIRLSLNFGQRSKYSIKTGNKFFNHMLTGLASRACFNLNIKYSSKVDDLDHVVTEDVGLSLGRAIREVLGDRQKKGVNQRGSYTVAFDEALVSATLAFDGRAYDFLRGNVPALKLEWVEDIQVANLKQFFEGFSQGSGSVVQVQFWAGNDPHHTWEAAFKAFGEALRESLLPCLYRANTTIGLKGTGIETKPY